MTNRLRLKQWDLTVKGLKAFCEKDQMPVSAFPTMFSKAVFYQVYHYMDCSLKQNSRNFQMDVFADNINFFGGCS